MVIADFEGDSGERMLATETGSAPASFFDFDLALAHSWQTNSCSVSGLLAFEHSRR